MYLDRDATGAVREKQRRDFVVALNYHKSLFLMSLRRHHGEFH